MNKWHTLLKSDNKKVFNEMNRMTRVDPAKWYANNCIFTTGNGWEGMKPPFQEFIAEGDKTLIPLKYFLLGYIKYLKDKGEKVQDVDFFFNPRDFPILKKNNMEPYDQIYPEKKLDNEYIHKSYTPILSQSGHTEYHDIPIPTEDDMMRITNDIYSRN